MCKENRVRYPGASGFCHGASLTSVVKITLGLVYVSYSLSKLVLSLYPPEHVASFINW